MELQAYVKNHYYTNVPYSIMTAMVGDGDGDDDGNGDGNVWRGECLVVGSERVNQVSRPNTACSLTTIHESCRHLYTRRI